MLISLINGINASDLQDWKEDNEIHISDVINRFKEKVESKEGELSRRMESITHTVTDMRRELETKQETVIDQLLQEKEEWKEIFNRYPRKR